MGLAICRKIVELLGGSITIHGVPGAHGTDVRIVLPSSVPARWPTRELTVEPPRRDRGVVPA